MFYAFRNRLFDAIDVKNKVPRAPSDLRRSPYHSRVCGFRAEPELAGRNGSNKLLKFLTALPD